MRPARRRLSVDELARGVLAGDRSVLGRALTLIESNNPRHLPMAGELLLRLTPSSGEAIRMGVSGVPGAGKSTFIEALGGMLLERGRTIAVLAVDPSSRVSGGSILGDKTRMSRLSADPRAFVRPSPTGGSLGGVTRKTREAIVLCEAAGFDTVLVETVGVGQSEVAVADMVDLLLVLLLPNAGDELQGIKRGILEQADVLAINKADGEYLQAARRSRLETEAAARFMPALTPGWRPPVLTVSARTGDGLSELWGEVERYVELCRASGELERKRQVQRLRWMWAQVEEGLMSALRSHPEIRASLPRLEEDVLRGDLTPTMAARRILEAFGLDGPSV